MFKNKQTLLKKIETYIKILLSLKNEDKRSIKAKKNIIASFGIKGVSVLVNLMIIPLTINYVNATQYGVWLTLSSIIGWFSFFDIGFGHGLRNKYAEAIANGNFDRAKIYLSTTYAILTLIFTLLFLLFFFVNTYIDWSSILNTKEITNIELRKIAQILFCFFCLQMIFKIISTLLIANQNIAKASFLDSASQFIIFLVIFILTKTTEGNLVNLAFVIGFIPVMVFILASIYYYSTDYRSVVPAIKSIDFSYAKDLMSLGAKFFFIQIAVIIIYQTNNLIITKIASPEDVTIFNIVYKYLGVALMLFTILISPYWSAITEAYTKQDYIWITKTVKMLRKISYKLFFLIILLVLFSSYAYELWIGDKIYIPFKVTIAVGLYVLVLCLVGLNTQILNGIGKIRLQLYTYSIATVGHIPLAFYLGNKIGIIGVILSGVFFYTIICFFSIKQVNLILDNKARGIWNK